MTTLSTYGTSYPKILINEGDTIVAITKDQLKEINLSLNKGKHCELEREQLNDIISVQDSLVCHSESKSEVYDSIISIKDFEVSELKSKLQTEKKAHRKVVIKSIVISSLSAFITGFTVGNIINSK